MLINVNKRNIVSAPCFSDTFRQTFNFFYLYLLSSLSDVTIAIVKDILHTRGTFLLAIMIYLLAAKYVIVSLPILFYILYTSL